MGVTWMYLCKPTSKEHFLHQTVQCMCVIHCGGEVEEGAVCLGIFGSQERYIRTEATAIIVPYSHLDSMASNSLARGLTSKTMKVREVTCIIYWTHPGQGRLIAGNAPIIPAYSSNFTTKIKTKMLHFEHITLYIYFNSAH